MGLMDNLKKKAEEAGQKVKILADIAKLISEKKQVLTLLKKTYEDAGETIMSLYRDHRDIHAMKPILDEFLDKILDLEKRLRDIETKIADKKSEAAKAGVSASEIEKIEE